MRPDHARRRDERAGLDASRRAGEFRADRTGWRGTRGEGDRSPGTRSGRSGHPALGALIFDVDGTLAETEEAHRACFNRSFAEFGLSWKWGRDLYKRLLDVSGGKERIRHFIEAEGAAPNLDAAAIARLHARKTRHYAEFVQQGRLGLRPGVARLLGDARSRGVRLAVATTTSLPNVEALLAATLGREALGWFEVIAAGDAVAAKKPAPDIYRLALDRLRLSPGEGIAFEDSWNGLAAASAAGLRTVVTASLYTRDHDFTGALCVLDHLGEAGLPCHALFGRNLPGAFLTLDDLDGWAAP